MSKDESRTVGILVCVKEDICAVIFVVTVRSALRMQNSGSDSLSGASVRLQFEDIGASAGLQTEHALPVSHGYARLIEFSSDSKAPT